MWVVKVKPLAILHLGEGQHGTSSSHPAGVGQHADARHFPSLRCSSPIVARSPCASFAPAATWGWNRSRSIATPTGCAACAHGG